MIGMLLFMLAQVAQPPSPTIPWASSALLVKMGPDPVLVVTVVPDGDGWLVVAGSRKWSSLGKVSCGDMGATFPTASTKVIVHRDGGRSLTISMSCPEKKP